VQSAGIVEALDISEQIASGLVSRGIDPVMDPLGLEGVEEALHRGVGDRDRFQIGAAKPFAERVHNLAGKAPVERLQLSIAFTAFRKLGIGHRQSPLHSQRLLRVKLNSNS
jgi:hypothetical protein